MFSKSARCTSEAQGKLSKQFSSKVHSLLKTQLTSKLSHKRQVYRKSNFVEAVSLHCCVFTQHANRHRQLRSAQLTGSVQLRQFVQAASALNPACHSASTTTVTTTTDTDAAAGTRTKQTSSRRNTHRRNRSHSRNRKPPAQQHQFQWFLQAEGESSSHSNMTPLPTKGKLRIGRFDEDMDQKTIELNKTNEGETTFLYLEDLLISRSHAELEISMDKNNEPRVYVTDLDSVNGTFVRRGRVRPQTRIQVRHNDVLNFGGLLEPQEGCFRLMRRRVKKASDGRPQKSDTSSPKDKKPAAKPDVIEVQPGNPIGRKVLGKPTVAWLSAGMKSAADRWVAGDRLGEGQGLVEFTSLYLDANPTPEGAEDKCELVKGHTTTVWDHFQRNVQEVLVAQSSDDSSDKSWMQLPAWKELKALPSSSIHKPLDGGASTAAAGVQTPMKTSSDEASNKEGQTTKKNSNVQRSGQWSDLLSSLMELEKAVKSHSEKLESQLVLERAAEVKNVMAAIAGTFRNVDSSEEDAEGGSDGVEVGTEEAELATIFGPLMVAAQSSGLGGVLLLTLTSAEGPGRRILPGLSPGDEVALGTSMSMFNTDCGDDYGEKDYCEVFGDDDTDSETLGLTIGEIYSVNDSTVTVAIQRSSDLRKLEKTELLIKVPSSVTHERNISAVKLLNTTIKQAIRAVRTANKSGNPPALPASTAILATLIGSEIRSAPTSSSELLDPSSETADITVGSESSMEVMDPAVVKALLDLCELDHTKKGTSRRSGSVETTSSNDSEETPAMKPLREMITEMGEGLDEAQQSVVETALCEDSPVSVIQGPPGTGKTGVLTALIKVAVERKQRVLAAAPSNAAVDNLVERLAAEGLNVVRLGNPLRVSEGSLQFTLAKQLERNLEDISSEINAERASLRRQVRSSDATARKTINSTLRRIRKAEVKMQKEETLQILLDADVVLGTLAGCGDEVLSSLPRFDLGVVDEAGQATEPSSWIGLLRSRRVILAGDSLQLPPTVISQDALNQGLGVSLLERADQMHQGRLTSWLRVQYRMHPAISAWASEELYSGRLETSPVVNKTLPLVLEKRFWRKMLRNNKACDNFLENSASSEAVCETCQTPAQLDVELTSTPLLLLDTRLPNGRLMQQCEEEKGGYGMEMCSIDGCLKPSSLQNPGEALSVARHIARLLRAGVAAGEIVVQSPYTAQVELIRDTLINLPGAEGVEVASVDSFQGREADAVVISMVRSNPQGSVGFLADKRRLNVAVTRARQQVAIVCDSRTVSANPVLSRFLQHISKNGKVGRADI